MKYWLLCIYVSVTVILNAQNQDSARIYVDLPLLEMPFQNDVMNTYSNAMSLLSNPGMNQSLHWSNSFYTLSHYYIDKAYRNKTYAHLTIMLFDMMSMYVPLGVAWMHEEYHRSVLTIHRARSFNDVYRFPFFAEFIAVSHVKDSDLIRISDFHKADFRRLNTAGMESQIMQVRQLQKENFFRARRVNHTFLYIYSIINTFFYIYSCSNTNWDASVDEANKLEGYDVNKRDMTGLDFTAWAYALYNPQIPYEDRGVHPSGVGLNRYIKPSQLSPAARRYLKTQSFLNLLNLLSPMILGLYDIKLSGNMFGNASLRHFLTPFGNNIAVDALLKNNRRAYMITLNTYSNRSHIFFGLEGNMYNVQLMDNFTTSIGMGGWLQPKNLDFYDSEARPGGFVSTEIAYTYKRFQTYLELSYKTFGWQPGYVYLDKRFNILFGTRVNVGK